MKKGKLIVLDGADGAGKATQTKLLIARLKKEKKTVKTLDFPRYESNFFGKLIGECLTGAHGDFAKLSPYIVSPLYAADRFESKEKIVKWLKSGYTVVLDRYVSANQIHQGGKIADTKERKRFLAWLEKMEFGIYGLPKPEVIFYLDVPYEISQKLLATAKTQKTKQYLTKGKKDTVENDEEYLRKSRESAVKMVKTSNQWERIMCTARGVLLSPQEIHEQIWDRVKKYLLPNKVSETRGSSRFRTK
jgi:dTMP kinase